MTAGLKKTLGLFDAIALVSGTMIGSGIFIVSSDIAKQVNSTLLLLLVWLIAGVMTIFAVLSYSELSVAIPETGGQYIYLRKIYGKLVGFLYGWTFFLVIQTGVIAAVSVAFAKFLAIIVPFFDSSNYIINSGFIKFSTQQCLAIFLIVFISMINTRGTKFGVMIQNTFTVAKIISLLGIIICGLFIGLKPEILHLNFSNFWSLPHYNMNVFSVMAVALVGALFSADSWNNLTFIASEIKKPEKNLPLAFIFGTGSVILLYILTNLAYLSVLYFSQIKTPGEDIVAATMMAVIFGSAGKVIISLIILVSAFGCINGNVLAGARVLYAMANDGVLFKKLSVIDEKTDVPLNAIVIQGVWASMLVLSGSYSQLLDYIIFSALLFYILTVIGLFVFRRKYPEVKTAYRVPFYPYLPIAYCLMGSFVALNLLIFKPAYTWPGLIIVLSGIPVYYVWGYFSKKAETSLEDIPEII
jgi:basic amino acid/polyamine antiporter, APA family